MTTWSPTPESALARGLVRAETVGVLSTLSTELPGYPFGSVTPYGLDLAGRPTILVSSIAQHTRNMQDDPRVSLTIQQTGAGNAQARGRVTIVADAAPATDQAAALERYVTFFPEAAGYAQAHDFACWTLTPRRVRLIAGFGQIHWIEHEDWLVPAPAWEADAAGIVSHMNTDHTDACAAIAAAHGGAAGSAAELVAVDPEGLHLRAGEQLVYAPFDAPALDAETVREAVIRLTRATQTSA